jgi:hypothetical protein
VTEQPPAPATTPHIPAPRVGFTGADGRDITFGAGPDARLAFTYRLTPRIIPPPGPDDTWLPIGPVQFEITLDLDRAVSATWYATTRRHAWWHRAHHILRRTR